MGYSQSDGLYYNLDSLRSKKVDSLIRGTKEFREVVEVSGKIKNTEAGYVYTHMHEDTIIFSIGYIYHISDEISESYKFYDIYYSIKKDTIIGIAK